jgi:hypothetical protein
LILSNQAHAACLRQGHASGNSFVDEPRIGTCTGRENLGHKSFLCPGSVKSNFGLRK